MKNAFAFLAASIALFGCSSSSSNDANDAGSDAPTGIRAFTPPPSNPGANAILFSVSGEVLALGGYAFPPASNDEAAFVDGWELRFSRLLVTVDDITLSDNPDMVPSDQSQTGGVVATIRGPFAIDLHKGGSLPGKGGGGEQAVPIASLTKKDDGGAFDTTSRYAFGFRTIAADPNAINVNLDADGLADYQEMIAKGYTVFYVGTATFKGGSSCTSSGSTYDFTKLPQVVNFRLGFKSPTDYVNCQNPDDDPAEPFAGEEHERGVQTKPNTFVVAQVTIHTDHPFWESVIHDSPAHFDMIAARHVGETNANALLEDTLGVDPTDITDSNGAEVPWRSCLSTYTAKPGVMSFDPQNVPINPNAAPGDAIRDLYDFMVYNQSTQGHLNSDGLCAVERQYPSP